MEFPKLDPSQLPPFYEALSRLGDLLALASMLPVLFDCRFGARLGRLSAETKHQDVDDAPKQETQKKAKQKKQENQKEQKDRQQEAKQKKEGNQEEQEERQQDARQPEQHASAADGWPTIPLGFLSMLLLAASEVIACRGIFVPLTKVISKSKSKSKSRVEGPVGVLLEGIKKGQKAAEARAKKSKPQAGIFGSVETIQTIVVAALEQPEAFDIVHGLTMLVALGAVTISIAGNLALPALKELGRQRGVPLPRAAALLVPVLLFGGLQWQSLRKAWRALQGEQLLSKLQPLLHAAGLVAAAAPVPDKVAGVPTFAALQAASLAASLSAELVTGRLTRSWVQFYEKPAMTTLVDSHLMTFLVPTFIVIVWVSMVHLRRSPNHLLLAATLSVATSPAILVLGWGKVAPALGFGTQKPAESLVKAISIVYTFMGFLLILAGGTICILSAMVIGQVLARIQGPELFTQMFS